MTLLCMLPSQCGIISALLLCEAHWRYWRSYHAQHIIDVGAPLHYIALYDYTATRHIAYETPAADHLQDQIFCSRP